MVAWISFFNEWLSNELRFVCHLGHFDPIRLLMLQECFSVFFDFRF